MKNFSEATDIKPTLQCNVKLVLTPIGTLPVMITADTRTVYEDTISGPKTLEWTVALTDPIDVRIQVYRHHPDAVVVALYIDDIEILPMYQDQCNPPTCYINFNSVWHFQIPSFYPWLHSISGQGWIA
jgi:hypothetical protein